jgi:hypothetical protein
LAAKGPVNEYYFVVLRHPGTDEPRGAANDHSPSFSTYKAFTETLRSGCISTGYRFSVNVLVTS